MTIYDFSVNRINGMKESLAKYKGKVILIVNTASECGFTPQLAELQTLYDTYKHDEFVILGFPCNQFGKQDPGSNEDIANFCTQNYGVTFPMFEKVDVKGDEANPLFDYLTKEASGLITQAIKWNFTKFLISKDGEIIKRFAPQTKAPKITKLIEREIKKCIQ